MKRRIVLCLAVSALAFSVVAESLNDALRWAYDSNPDILAQRAQIRQAIENIEIQKSALRPQVNFTAGYTKYDQIQLSTGSDQGAQAQLTASLLLWDGGQTRYAVEATKASVRSAEAQLRAYEQNILLQTVQAYIDVLNQQQNLSLQQSNKDVLSKQVSSAEISFDEGALQLEDLQAIRANSSSADAQIAVARASLAAAAERYRALTGREPGNLEDVSMPKLPGSGEAVKELALKQHPLVTAAIENERAAQYDLRRAEQNRMPQVQGQVAARSANALNGLGSQESAELGLSVSVPLYAGGRLSALQRQAQAALEQRASETNSQRAAVVENALSAWAQLESMLKTVDAYGAVVEAQKVAVEGAEVKFDLGANTIIDKLDVEQDLLEARTQLSSARYSHVLAAYNVVAAMGQLTAPGQQRSQESIAVEAAAPVKEEKSTAAQAVEQLGSRWDRN